MIGRVATLLCALLFPVVLFGQDIRTQELVLDDDAATITTRNALTLRGPFDDSLTTDYFLHLPSQADIGVGSLLFIDSWSAATATSRWLTPRANSVLSSDASGNPVWTDATSVIAPSQWVDGDSIGIASIIYAAQAMNVGTADTVVVTDDGDFGLGTSAPDALFAMQGAGTLLSARDNTTSLRSTLNDEGEQNWYLGNATGDFGRARVGSLSGYPTFSLYRPGNVSQFDIVNRATYTGIGFNADGADTGSVLAIAQGGNVGVGTATPQNKLHITAASDPVRIDGLALDLTLDSVIVVDATGTLHYIPADSLITRVFDSAYAASAWLVEGNDGTNPTDNFVGTSDAQDLSIRANSVEHIRLNQGNGATYISNYPTASGSGYTTINTLDFRQSNVQATGGNGIFNSLVFGSAGSTGTINAQINSVDVQANGTFGTMRALYNRLLFGTNSPTVGTYYGVLSEIPNGGSSGTIGSYYGYRSSMIGNPSITDAWGVSIGAPNSATTSFTGVEVDNIPSGAGTRTALLYDGTGSNEPFIVNAAGQVGIGTLAPTAGRLLEVDGTAGTANVRMTSLSGAAATTTLGVDEGFVIGDANGDLVKRDGETVVGQFAWLLEGNSGTVDGTNFLGTIDDVPFNIRANNERAFRIEPSSVPNLIGGHSSNAVGAGGDGQTIGGGTSNTISANYGTVGGGRDNLASGVDATVGGGQRNTASSIDATVAGGEDNTASGDISTVGGGDENTASGYGSTVAGGESGTASGNYATLSGGEDNIASAHYSTVSGGWGDTASGYASVVAGGEDNVADGSRSAIGGGLANRATGGRAFIGAGEENFADGSYAAVPGGYRDSATGHASVVSGGEYNVASGSRSSIAGGGNNTANGSYSTIGGGRYNSLTDDYSAIPGGRGLTLNGSGAFGFLGNNVGANDMTIADSDIAVLGNVDLWLANNDNNASTIRFYEPGNTTGAYPGGHEFTSFAAQAQANDIEYLLPAAAGSTGEFLSIASVAGTTVTLDWSSPGGSSNAAWLLGGNSGTTAGTNFLGTTDNEPLELKVNDERVMRYQPRSASPSIVGGYSGNVIDAGEDGNVIGGGGSSGRINEIGSGVDYAAILGGREIEILDGSDRAIIVGGEENSINTESDFSFIAGGEDNEVSGVSEYASILGGRDNTIESSGDYTTILGGRGLTLQGTGSLGYLGDNTGSNNMTVSDDDVSVLGNVDLWMANNNSTASQIRFYEPKSGAGTFPNGAEFTSFEAQPMANDIRYLLPSSAGSAGEFLSIASVAGTTVTLDWASASGGGGTGWLTTGNSGTTLGTNFLGTTDNEGLDIRVNNTRVMRYEPHNVSPNIIGGHNGNSVQTSEEGNVIAGGGRTGQLNTAGEGVDFGVISGGLGNALAESADYTVIGGGEDNTIEDESDWATIGGGMDNMITDTTLYSTIAGGRANRMDNDGNYSAIGGGYENEIYGQVSVIPGGRGMRLDGQGSFGFLGGNTGANDMTVTASDVAVLGNVDLWLANNNNSASEMRFYEPENGTGAFPSTTHYTSLRAQAQDEDIEYLFPDTAGIVGDVLSVTAVSGTQITLDWKTPNESGAVGQVIFARKTANETVAGTALQNDDHLSLALAAGRTYEISGALFVERASGTPDLSLAWTVPGGTGTAASNSTMLISFYAFERKNNGNRDVGGDTRTVSGQGATDGPGEVTLSNNLVTVHFKGLVVVGTTAGNIRLQWAPTTGGGDQVEILENSYMRASLTE